MIFETRTTVAAAPADVWPALADVVAWPDYIATMSTVQPLGEGPLGLGSEVRVKQPKMPALVWRVTEWTPQVAFVWETAALGVTTIARHDLSPHGDGGTEVRLSISQTGFLAPAIGLLTGARTRRYIEIEAAALKTRCEDPQRPDA
ncbi:SRPBCC family protein (plasmid) [Streptomycetaceae bacterium NBC_01309]